MIKKFEEYIPHQNDMIPGGKGDSITIETISSFDPLEIGMGVLTELEHTGDYHKAIEIAFDHLVEDPQYYTKLKDAGLADELE